MSHVFEDTPLTELVTELVAHPGRWARVITRVNHSTASAVHGALVEAVALQGFADVQVTLQPVAVLWGVWARYQPSPPTAAAPVERRRAAPAPPREIASGPTVEQQRQIKALQAENAAIVARTQRKRASAGRCEVPLSAMAEYMRPMATAAVGAGWEITVQGNNHLRWTSPTGERVVTPVTGQTQGSAPRNVKAELRRAGAPVS